MEATVIFQLRDDGGGTRGVDRWRGRGAPGIWLRSKCGSGRLWPWEGESGVKAKQVAAGKARTGPLPSQLSTPRSFPEYERRSLERQR